MKKKEVRILLVDDHPMILEGYKNVLSRAKLEEVRLQVESVDNCDKAWVKIRGREYDVIFIDINFSNVLDGKIVSGEELGKKVKLAYPSIKVVVLTVLESRFRVEQILRNINPDGFLLKGETTSKNFLRCLEMVLVSENYYSPKISNILRSRYSTGIVIDEVDEEILRQLSMGSKTKEIAASVNLSVRAVEDRKRKIKESFGVAGENTRIVLKKAKEYGYI